MSECFFIGEYLRDMFHLIVIRCAILMNYEGLSDLRSIMGQCKVQVMYKLHKCFLRKLTCSFCYV